MLKACWLVVCGLVVVNAFAAKELNTNQIDIDKQLNAIESKYKVKLGLYAHDTNSGKTIAHHATQAFPFQSTCKFMGVAALLAKDSQHALLDKQVKITPKDMIAWHPISGQYLNHKVSLKTLAKGAVAYSDNPAINVIMRELGGLDSINRFARSIGNHSFTIKHYEANLNPNPTNGDDTSTPLDMGVSVEKILLGKVLSKSNNALLMRWMLNNTTGNKRIRAGVPLGWSVAEKTGSGNYGVANDIGLSWSPTCKPVVLSIYTIGKEVKMKPNDAVISQVTQAVFNEFSKYHACYRTTQLS